MKGTTKIILTEDDINLDNKKLAAKYSISIMYAAKLKRTFVSSVDDEPAKIITNSISNEFGDKAIREKILQNIEDDMIKEELLSYQDSLNFLKDKNFYKFNEIFLSKFNSGTGCYVIFKYITSKI